MNCRKLTECSFCKKPIYQNSTGFFYKQKTFCDSNCRNQFNMQTKDPKKFMIVKNKNEDFYYLIGLIVTDGYLEYVSPDLKTRTWCVSIKNMHRDFLESIKNKLGGTISKHKHKDSFAYTLNFNNKELVDYLLSEVGLTHNKSLTVDIKKWFITLTEQQKWWFWRGVLDGDGSIFFTIKNPRYPSVVYTLSIASGSSPFLNLILDFFKIGNICKTEYRVSRNKKIVNILSKIYVNMSENSLFLTYKYERYKKIIEIEEFMEKNNLETYKYEPLLPLIFNYLSKKMQLKYPIQ